MASSVFTSDASVYRAGGWVSCPSASTEDAARRSPVRIGGSDPLSSVSREARFAAASPSPAPIEEAAGAAARRPSPVAFMNPGNSITVPDAWNIASPSSPAGADRRTVAVEPVASAIWEASVRCQISVYSFSWSAGTLPESSAGSWNRAPAGRMHSWASCALAVFVTYCLGPSDRNDFPK